MKGIEINNVRVEKPVISEAKMIAHILNLARAQGVEEKVKKIISDTQNNIKGAKSEEERKQIAHLGLALIHTTIGCVDALVVDGIEIVPEDRAYKDAVEQHKTVTKLD